jgi:cytochrome b6-f complex iron-sulfur subunit
MSSTTILAIAIPVLLVLGGVLVFSAARRRDANAASGVMSSETARRDRGPVQLSEAAEAPVTGREVERAAVIERREAAVPAKVTDKAPVAWVPPDPEALAVTRRHFFNLAIITTMGLSLSGFGAAVLAFLWPSGAGGFGAKITVGKFEDIDAEIEKGDGFAYYPEGRMWVTHYPKEALQKAKAVYSPPELNGMEAGYVALYQKCPHLGCRVPACTTSQWFECPCHGSQYNRVGEKKGGPAPRGMDRFAMEAKNDTLNVDTGTIIPGPPIGTNTTGQEVEGPHCVSGGH